MKILLTALFSLFAISLYSETPLLIPSTISGTQFDLNLQKGSHQFYDGIDTPTMGVNGNILGPTLIFEKGDFININVKNGIGDTTTIHWHGLHVSPKNDGGPHTIILPGETWSPSFEVRDEAATYWYHPHLHQKTNIHVSLGIAGFIIVRDEKEAKLDLPRTYGVDDFPLVIQTKTFDDDKKILAPHNADSVVMVNATIDPFLDVPAQVVRLRLLNGSSQRSFIFGFANDEKFYQIASDGGLLEKSNEIERLRLAPGERAEILFDFSNLEGQELTMMSYASEFPRGIFGSGQAGRMAQMTLKDYKPNVLNGADFNVIKFKVGAANSNPVTSIINELVKIDYLDENDATVTRKLSMRPELAGPNALNGVFTFDSKPFDMEVINQTVQLNDTEIWEITNNSPIAHPFHIHDVQFYILSRSASEFYEAEKGRKDVVLIHSLETVRLIMKFDDFADPEVPYMYHCHMLTHEDKGMMGQFLVMPANSVENIDDDKSIIISPQPSSDFINIDYSDLSISNIKSINIINMLGKELNAQYKVLSNKRIDISNLEAGTYFLEIILDGKSSEVKYKKFIRTN